jgi:hypothetical protein
MSPTATISPELRRLVELGTITDAQAAEAMRNAPTDALFDGYAQCMNVNCDSAQAARNLGQLRPLALRRTVCRTMAPDMPVLISQTTHIEVVNDDDLACPECGSPCAILESKPPTYDRLAPGGSSA